MPVQRVPRHRRVAAAAIVAISAVGLPLVAIGSHMFGDVPNSNPFHSDISAIAAAGVTSGCGGGNYCPTANVTREQMAAFMNRLGALSPGKTPVVNAAKLDGLTASQFERSDTPTSGHFNCAGNTLQPIYNGGSLAWGVTGAARTVTSGATFGCGVVLPDGAVVGSVDFYVADYSTTEQVIGCLLGRLALATGVAEDMATSPATGAEGDPGPWLLDANVFAGSVVDNGTYAYYAQCTLSGPGTEIRGVSVSYSLTGLAVP